MRTKRTRTDFDSAWKLALEAFFPACMELLFPQLHALIDWQRDHLFLNTELRKLRPLFPGARRFVDALVRVAFKDGHERFVYLHIEIQAQRDPLFGLRMFVYHYHVFEALHYAELVSLAILADSDPHWRPETFTRALGGCEITFRFPTVKLLDMEEATLEAHSNPFAAVVLAHLRALKARGNPQLLFEEKVRLLRTVLRRGYNPEDIVNLYKVVDYLMALPKELESQVNAIVREVARRHGLRKLTSLEREALERGARQGLEEGLQEGLQKGIQQGFQQGIIKVILLTLRSRFGEVPARLERRLRQVPTVEQLEQLSLLASGVPTLKAFEQALADVLAQPSR